VGIDLLGEIERLPDRLTGLAGQAQNERAVDDDASSWQSLVKRRAKSTRMPLLDVEQDLLIADS